MTIDFSKNNAFIYEEMLATAMLADEATEDEVEFLFPDDAVDMVISKWQVTSPLLEIIQQRLDTDDEEIFLYETTSLSFTHPVQDVNQEILTVGRKSPRKTFESYSRIENFTAMLAWAAEGTNSHNS